MKKCSEDFDKYADHPDESTYRRLGPILRGALYLSDRIRRDFRRVYYRADLGSAGGLDLVEHAKGKKKYLFPFAGLPSAEWRLTKGAQYPLFAAYRNKVWINPETGLAEWKGDSIPF